MWPNIDPNSEIPNIPPSLFHSLSLSLTVCRVLAEPTQLTISTKSLWPPFSQLLLARRYSLALSLSLYIYVCVCENHLFGCWENEVRRWEIRNLWTFILCIFFLMKMVYVKVLWLLGKWDEKLEIFVPSNYAFSYEIDNWMCVLLKCTLKARVFRDWVNN